MAFSPMFPAQSRKCPPSLYACAKKASNNILVWYINSDRCNDEKDIRKVRKYTRQTLPAVILTDLLDSIIPNPDDKWRFPCAGTVDRLRCRIHEECKIVHQKLDQVIKVMFSEDISHLSFNLKTINIEIYHSVVSTLIGVMTKLPSRPFPLLRNLSICGGSALSDNIVTLIEELCEVLKDFTSNLESLHLPVASNIALRSVSDIKKLRSFRSDRTKAFNKRGLYHLCHPESHSRDGLKVLHLGVFKHAHFEKQDVADFIKCMSGLTEFSMLDSQRALVRLDGSSKPGDKVLSYSVFKRAIRVTEESSSDHPTVDGVLNTNLREMFVVDRSLKPHYILESAPKLHRLRIDWQQELCFPPFNRFKVNWFSDMILGQSWAILASRLTSLDITFPASHTINSYSLPLTDFTNLMQNLANLDQLRLEGAGQGGPIPLIPILRYCPKLSELKLSKCPVHVPEDYEVVDDHYVSRTLKRFYFLGEMSSLLVHDFMMRGISRYMPTLTELEVQPQTVLGYRGLKPEQILELSRLQYLERLSIPLSIRECIMNLPHIIFVLREFPSLRFLTLSWGMLCDSYDISSGKISYMMQWLLNALEAENANIHLQLSYEHHPHEFRS